MLYFLTSIIKEPGGIVEKPMEGYLVIYLLFFLLALCRSLTFPMVLIWSFQRPFAYAMVMFIAKNVTNYGEFSFLAAAEKYTPLS